MKKKIFPLILSLPLLFGCSDVIPEGERYEELPPIEAKRHILIEDFTGQFCSNCPDAHKVIHELQQQYGEGVIAVAIHAGNFGVAEGSNSKITGLMQPDGNTYADYWKVETYPAGLINRTSGLLKHTDWAAYTREALSQEAIMDITLDCKVSDDSTMLTIDTDINSNIDINGKLQLWITESNITAVQQNGGSLEPNYTHHHVYRAAVNGLWGNDVNLKGYIPYSSTHQMAVSNHWDINNLSVVAFVYNDADGVLEVTEQHVSPNI